MYLRRQDNAVGDKFLKVLLPCSSWFALVYMIMQLLKHHSHMAGVLLCSQPTPIAIPKISLAYVPL